jgi:pyruvate-formate lyase-activating enzyme
VNGLAYADARGHVYFDERVEPLADGGVVRAAERGELRRAPRGTIPVMLPARRPLLAGGRVAKRRTALAALLPAGYTRLLLPAYVADDAAPPLPLYGYTYACVVGDALYVAATRTDERDDWAPRTFARGELESAIEARRARDPANRVLAQLEICARDYACFTAQNVFLEVGEAALPASPRCNARCIGCISELDADAGIPSPQVRIAYETTVDELARIARSHLERVPAGIVSFGQGCEGEPLLRPTTLARTIAAVRAGRANGTLNCNTNGSRPTALGALIDAGLDAVRVSLNSFRPATYAAYYRPRGYGLDDVFESVRLASSRGLRVSLNLLTHPGVTDDADEVRAMEAFLREVRVDLVQTRTLNIDPAAYFAAVGRPREPLGMRSALRSIRDAGVRVGNFTHTH